MNEKLTDEEMDRAYCLADLKNDKYGHKAIAKVQIQKLADMGYGRMGECPDVNSCPCV